MALGGQSSMEALLQEADPADVRARHLLLAYANPATPRARESITCRYEEAFSTLFYQGILPPFDVVINCTNTGRMGLRPVLDVIWRIEVSGAAPGTGVYVVNCNGMLLDATVDSQGCCALDTMLLPIAPEFNPMRLLVGSAGACVKVYGSALSVEDSDDLTFGEHFVHGPGFTHHYRRGVVSRTDGQRVPEAPV